MALSVLLISLLAAGCVSTESWQATRLLQDIDAGGGASALKDLTPAPRRTAVRYEVDGRAGSADIYEPGQPIGGALILVPGFTAQGKNDRRVVDLARSLARASFLVLVPEVPGSRQLRVRPEDARNIADAITYMDRHRPEATGGALGVAAVSYAVGPAILAALEVEKAAPIDFLIGIGGYYDTLAVITFATTGYYRSPGTTRWARGAHLAAAKWIVLSSYAAALNSPDDRARLQALGDDCLDGCDIDRKSLFANLGAEASALLALILNEDPAQVPRLVEALPATVAAQLRQLSPRNHDLTALTGRLVLIHGRLDPLIPYSESLALAQAVPKSEIFLIDGFSHIDPKAVGWVGQLQLIDAIQAVLKRRRPIAQR
ncbi:MAG: hypothetical protein RH942_10295 [Kiloniellaceae bacterium]